MSYLQYIRQAITYITGEPEDIKNELKYIISYNEEGERVIIEWIDHIV